MSEETAAEISWIYNIAQSGIMHEYQKPAYGRKKGNAFSAEETKDSTCYSSSLLLEICNQQINDAECSGDPEDIVVIKVTDNSLLDSAVLW